MIYSVYSKSQFQKGDGTMGKTHSATWRDLAFLKFGTLLRTRALNQKVWDGFQSKEWFRFPELSVTLNMIPETNQGGNSYV